VDPEVFLDGHPTALAVYRRVRSQLRDLGDVGVEASKSQISLLRRLREAMDHAT
jgi:hypothetical protein